MDAYVRPALEDPVFRDATGAVIAYGDRWGAEGPPEDTYSVTTHPERFRPLHDVADALVAHLTAFYDVEVTSGTAAVGDVMTAPPQVVRATRLRPRDPRATPLTLVHTDAPGIDVHAGLLLDASFPHCGCDACDDTWQSQASELEWLVRAVTAGGFREWVTRRDGQSWVGRSLRTSDGRASSSESAADTLPADRLRRVTGELVDSAEWEAWPTRQGR